MLLQDSLTSVPRRPSVGVSIALAEGGLPLLIRRGKPPMLDRWAFPGGSVEWGETVADAAIREVYEETGLTCEIVGQLKVLDAIGPPDEAGMARSHFVLIVLLAKRTGGVLRPGSDTREALFQSLDGIAADRSVPNLHQHWRDAKLALDSLERVAATCSRDNLARIAVTCCRNDSPND